MVSFQSIWDPGSCFGVAHRRSKTPGGKGHTRQRCIDVDRDGGCPDSELGLYGLTFQTSKSLGNRKSLNLDPTLRIKVAPAITEVQVPLRGIVVSRKWSCFKKAKNCGTPSTLEVVDKGPIHFFWTGLAQFGKQPPQSWAFVSARVQHPHHSEASVRAQWLHQSAWLIWAQRCQKGWRRKDGMVTFPGSSS